MRRQRTGLSLADEGAPVAGITERAVVVRLLRHPLELASHTIIPRRQLLDPLRNLYPTDLSAG